MYYYKNDMHWIYQLASYFAELFDLFPFAHELANSVIHVIVFLDYFLQLLEASRIDSVLQSL